MYICVYVCCESQAANTTLAYTTRMVKQVVNLDAVLHELAHACIGLINLCLERWCDLAGVLDLEM